MIKKTMPRKKANLRRKGENQANVSNMTQSKKCVKSDTASKYGKSPMDLYSFGGFFIPMGTLSFGGFLRNLFYQSSQSWQRKTKLFFNYLLTFKTNCFILKVDERKLNNKTFSSEVIR